MKYFGTDGIRQKAELFDGKFLRLVAKGLADYGKEKVGEDFKVLIAGDTRESTEWMLREFEAAFETLGVEYGNAGVLPTPAIATVFCRMGFDFAIDITASHNPYTDNGIKIFECGADSGEKLCERGCEMIESALASGQDFDTVSTELREDLHDEALAVYEDFLTNYVGEADFSGLTIGMDCANGAMSVINKHLFEKFGAKVLLINVDDEYGQSINAACGSTHLEPLTDLVKKQGVDFGVAFDGDGDRCLLIDEHGKDVDGDQILAILAEAFGYKKMAITVMSNQGLLDWAKKKGVELETTPVGDHNVMLAMREKHIPLGGEQCGHIILPGQTSGDGMLSALMVAKALGGRSLSQAAAVMTRFPQVINNMAVSAEQKAQFKDSEGVKKVLLNYNERIAKMGGRLLVRPSGTENIVRITMWGKDEGEIKTLANELENKLLEVL